MGSSMSISLLPSGKPYKIGAVHPRSQQGATAPARGGVVGRLWRSWGRVRVWYWSHRAAVGDM